MNQTQAAKLAEAINRHEVSGYTGRAYAVPSSRPRLVFVDCWKVNERMVRPVVLREDPRDDS